MPGQVRDESHQTPGSLTHPFFSPAGMTSAVLEWFAERVDRIILLFTPKLDISDRALEVIKALKNHEDKIRVVLNKADSD